MWVEIEERGWRTQQHSTSMAAGSTPNLPNPPEPHPLHPPVNFMVIRAWSPLAGSM